MFFIPFDDPFREAILDTIKKYSDLYGKPLGSGRNRVTWRVDNEVIKVPTNEWGVRDNEHEACFGQSYLNGERKLARCRRQDEPNGLPIVIMEYCIPYHKKISYTELPEWTNWIDCQQVGFNPDGELVAYDYGL